MFRYYKKFLSLILAEFHSLKLYITGQTNVIIQAIKMWTRLMSTEIHSMRESLVHFLITIRYNYNKLSIHNNPL
jgi:hypothetical protein